MHLPSSLLLSSRSLHKGRLILQTSSAHLNLEARDYSLSESFPKSSESSPKSGSSWALMEGVSKVPGWSLVTADAAELQTLPNCSRSGQVVFLGTLSPPDSALLVYNDYSCSKIQG